MAKTYARKTTTTTAARRGPGRPPSRPEPAPADEEMAEDIILSVKTQKMVDGIRSSFVNYVNDFQVLTATRESLAPRFMRAFQMWQEETKQTFVQFVRVLVPSVPEDRDGYRNDPAYQAATYLRRLEAVNARVETPQARMQRLARAPVNPRIALARLVASLVPLLSPEGETALWRALEGQLHWSDAQIKGLQTLVETETPLVRVRTPRGVHIEHSLQLQQVPAPAVSAAA
jgi:hypothetical protein